MAEESIHKGHRQRMLKRYLEHGIDSFEDHELLEIFLFSAYTRRNTNDIAHRLIERFGSLEGVMHADYDALCEVDDVGPTAAGLICFLKDFSRRCGKTDMSGIRLDSTERARSYCFELLRGADVEEAHIVFLDKSLNLIGESCISRGDTGSVELDLRYIVLRAIKTQCSNIIMTHCHPRGVLLASAADVASTRRIAASLSSIGITMIDHIIVNEEGSYSMRAARLLPDLWI